MRQIRRNVLHILTCQQRTHSLVPRAPNNIINMNLTPALKSPTTTTTTVTIKESHKNCHWPRCLTDGLSDEDCEDCEEASRAHLISGICSCPEWDAKEGGTYSQLVHAVRPLSGTVFEEDVSEWGRRCGEYGKALVQFRLSCSWRPQYEWSFNACSWWHIKDQATRTRTHDNEQ